MKIYLESIGLKSANFWFLSGKIFRAPAVNHECFLWAMATT